MVFSQIAIVFSIRLKAYASGMPLLPFSYGYAYDYNKHYPCYQNILRLKRNSAADYLSSKISQEAAFSAPRLISRLRS